MRFSELWALPVALLATPLAAQGFEGTIAMKISGDQPRELTWSFKGPLTAAGSPGAVETGAPAVSLIIDNSAHTTTALLPFSAAIGGTSQGMNGIAVVSPLSSATTSAVPAKTALRKLGTSQNIGGLTCEDYDLGDAAHTRACITNALGAFALPSASLGGGMAAAMPMLGGQSFSMGGDGVSNKAQLSVQTLPNGAQIITSSDGSGSADGGSGTFVVGKGGPGKGDTTSIMAIRTNGPDGPNSIRIATARDGSVTVDKNGEVTTYPNSDAAAGVVPGGMSLPRNAAPRTPSWAVALRGGGFPLKVWAADGSTILEITDLQHTSVPDALFTIPEGYQQAGGGRVITSGGGN